MGAYADYYASVLGELYEKSEAQFAWSCFGYLTDEQQDEVIYLLAYDLGIDSDEMRGILMSVLDE